MVKCLGNVLAQFDPLVRIDILLAIRPGWAAIFMTRVLQTTNLLVQINGHTRPKWPTDNINPLSELVDRAYHIDSLIKNWGSGVARPARRPITYYAYIFLHKPAISACKLFDKNNSVKVATFVRNQVNGARQFTVVRSPGHRRQCPLRPYAQARTWRLC